MKFRATPLQDWTGRLLNSARPVFVKRDDLLPFPLPGNKVRKLSHELKGVTSRTVVVTVGSVHSNHCRTTALMCAQRGVRSHFILHDDGADPVMSAAGTRMLDRLGASYEIVVPDDIRHAIETSVQRIEDEGCIVHVVEGGCHTPAGVEAYEDAAKELSRQVDEEPAYIFLASGTGATQAGLAVGCRKLGWSTSVVGISVARLQERGLEAVLQAVDWRDDQDQVNIVFTDAYRAGGYGKSDDRVRDAVDRAWRVGLPVDPVYTGKALAGLVDMDASGALEMPGPIVFWHTGGIFQAVLKDL